jgi:hypothetical protein
MKKFGLFLAIVIVTAGFAACGNQEKPEEKIIFDETKCPVEVGNISKSIGPQTVFNLSVKNVSPFDVTGFNAGAILFDENGKPLSTTPEEISFEGTIEPIKSGQTSQLGSSIDKEATTMKIVIKDCIYMKMNPVDEKFGELPYKWENKDYDKQIKDILTGK